MHLVPPHDDSQRPVVSALTGSAAARAAALEAFFDETVTADKATFALGQVVADAAAQSMDVDDFCTADGLRIVLRLAEAGFTIEGP